MTGDCTCRRDTAHDVRASSSDTPLHADVSVSIVSSFGMQMVAGGSARFQPERRLYPYGMPANDKRRSNSGRPQERATRVGKTSSWAKVGAVLGLLATLWTTLVGQTVPELLRANADPVAQFHAGANRVCAKLPQENSHYSSRPEGPAEVHPALRRDLARAYHLATQFNRRTVQPFHGTTQDLLTIVAPHTYEAVWPRFQQWMVALGRDLDALRSAVFDIASAASRAHLRASLVRAQRAYARAVRAMDQALLMRLDDCVAALAAKTNEIYALNETIAPALAQEIRLIDG
jgi:hypothetical protein